MIKKKWFKGITLVGVVIGLGLLSFIFLSLKDNDSRVSSRNTGEISATERMKKDIVGGMDTLINKNNRNMLEPRMVLSSPVPNAPTLIEKYLLPARNSKPRTEEITHIVLHFSSNAVNNPTVPYQFQDIYRIFFNNEVSSHYMIGRQGEIYQLVDENRVAYHAGKGYLMGFPQYENKLNEYSIGIELLAIGTDDEMLTFMPDNRYQSISAADIGYTDEQYESLNLLLNDIFTRNDTITRDRLHIVGHDEYAPGRKVDPGDLFDWSRLIGVGQATEIN